MGTFIIEIDSAQNYATSLASLGTAGEDILAGQVCYLADDGLFYLASASNEDAQTGEIRIAINSVASGDEEYFLEQGYFTNIAGFTQGATYYLSTTPGSITDTEYADGTFNRYIGMASKTSQLRFNPVNGATDSGSDTFNSDLGTIAIPSNWQDNAVGITTDDMTDLDLTGIVELLFLPTILASITESAYFYNSGHSTSTVEVGTSIVQNFTIVLVQGNINNGDGTSAGTVIGDLATVIVNNPDTSVGYQNAAPTGTTDVVTTVAYEVAQGTNTWTSIVTNVAGTTTYTDNKGGTDTVTDIETAKADTTRDDVTFSLLGVYNRYHYVGTDGGSPTASADIRALTSSFLSTSNTGSWNVDIAAGAGSAEFSFYIPSGKTISVIDTGNLNLDITADFTETSVTVEDAAGNDVTYSQYTRFAGAVGYTNPTNFEITVT